LISVGEWIMECVVTFMCSC